MADDYDDDFEPVGGVEEGGEGKADGNEPYAEDFEEEAVRDPTSAHDVCSRNRRRSKKKKFRMSRLVLIRVFKGLMRQVVWVMGSKKKSWGTP
jgi:hypothetical protein